MNKMGIHSVARERKYKRVIRNLEIHHYPNLLNRNFAADHPNQKWVTDVTYIHTRRGWAYLSVIKDLYDGFIVAHYLSKQNSLTLVLNTLRLAQQKETVTDGLIFHSDQGYQYRSHAYAILTKEYNFRPSMSRPGNCWDNAVIENFFGYAWPEWKPIVAFIVIIFILTVRPSGLFAKHYVKKV